MEEWLALVQDSLLPWGPFLGLPTSPAARALGPTSIPEQDGKKPKPVGRQLGQGLWNLIPTIFCPPSSLLAKTDDVCTRSSQDLELELRLVLTSMTLGSRTSEEDWEGKGEEGQILANMPCTSCHAYHATPTCHAHHLTSTCHAYHPTPTYHAHHAIPTCHTTSSHTNMPCTSSYTNMLCTSSHTNMSYHIIPH